MNTKNYISTFLTIMLLGIAAISQAAPQVSINTIAEKEEVVIVNGEQQRRFIPAETSVTGDTLRFTVHYSNTGDEPATGVILNNPVPTGAIYLADSASQTGVDNLQFSIDGGATYKKPNLLTYSVISAEGKTETRIAPPTEYTHIRWTINSLPPGGAGNVSYKALVE